jgi:hypothetical protein
MHVVGKMKPGVLKGTKTSPLTFYRTRQGLAASEG